MAVSKSRMIEIANTVSSPVIIDDHTGESMNIAAVAVLSIGDSRNHIVPLLPSVSHCLNAMSNQGGSWRQTKHSVSGMIDTRGVTVEQAIEAFNKSYEEGDLSGDIHHLTLVTKF